MTELSIIIPARNEKYLQKTIENVLANAKGEIEVIAVCDGYWPEPSIKDDPRVNIIHHTEARGQRQSINEAARIARGKIIGKLDAHCAVADGFDVKIAQDMEYDWTVVPRMYNLDIETFTPKLHKCTDYMYIGWKNGTPDCIDKNELRALYYTGNEWKIQHRQTAEIDDTMCCMGPGWFMHKDRYWELGGLDEDGHGSWGQMGIEVACKAWLSGGALKVNKKTWFAHWFRGSVIHEGGKKGWPYPISNKQIKRARRYSKDLWLNNKWPQQTRNFQWLIDKFHPPGWKEFPTEESRLKLFAPQYRHIQRQKNLPKWRGVDIMKFPNDLAIYHEVIYETKPEVIVEIGTSYGGSAVFFQDMLDMIGGGQVVTIDIKDRVNPKDPRIEYIIGNSIDSKVVKMVQKLTEGKRTMLVIDGNHDRRHVKWELYKYKDIVIPGQYMVIEDCYIDRGLYGPGEARDWFLERNKDFEQTNRCDKYLVGETMGGWLKKKAA